MALSIPRLLEHDMLSNQSSQDFALKIISSESEVVLNAKLDADGDVPGTVYFDNSPVAIHRGDLNRSQNPFFRIQLTQKIHFHHSVKLIGIADVQLTKVVASSGGNIEVPFAVHGKPFVLRLATSSAKSLQ